MGTLHEQRVKESGSIDESVDKIVVQLNKLERGGYSVSDGLMIIAAAQHERFLALEAMRQNAHDEQISGLGLIAENFVEAIEEFVSAKK